MDLVLGQRQVLQLKYTLRIVRSIAEPFLCGSDVEQ